MNSPRFEAGSKQLPLIFHNSLFFLKEAETEEEAEKGRSPRASEAHYFPNLYGESSGQCGSLVLTELYKIGKL